MKKLKLADELALPLEVVTQKLAWIGTTGSGKTYGATKLAELMWDAGAQFVVLDPVGVWYGLRLAADGKQPSDITIPIFGGLHGDVPLEPTGGALLADLIVDRAIAAVLDVSQFESDAQKARFAADFADRFFFRKKSSPSAVHLFVEECQEFIPEHQQRGEERMLHAFTRLQKIGRNFGIGSSLITQRPQEVAKKALNLAQTLFVFRTTGSHERAAIERWIKDKAIEGQDVMASLPKLKTGRPHVWSPEWLEMSQVVGILEKRTFDASATPEVGAAVVARELAPIDLERIRTDMAATIEKAKAEDPKLLQQTIAQLKRELAKKAVHVEPKVETKVERVAVPMLTEQHVKDLRDAAESIRMGFGGVRGVISHIEKCGLQLQLQEAMQRIDAAIAQATKPVQTSAKSPVVRRQPILGPPVQIKKRDDGVWIPDQGLPLKAGARRMLEQLAVWHPRALQRSELGVLAGVQSSGGTFSDYLSALRKNGYIEERGSQLSLTAAGMAAAGDVQQPHSTEEIVAIYASKLKAGARRMLDVLVQNHPTGLTRAQLGEAAAIDHTGGTFSDYLSSLRSAGLLDESQGDLRASGILFEGAA